MDPRPSSSSGFKLSKQHSSKGRLVDPMNSNESAARRNLLHGSVQLAEKKVDSSHGRPIRNSVNASLKPLEKQRSLQKVTTVSARSNSHTRDHNSLHP